MNWSQYSRYRRRHLRRAAGDGGARRVLLGVDVHRALDLRQGSPVARARTWRRSGSSRPARRCRRGSSSPPTRGCRIPSATSWSTGARGWTDIFAVLFSTTTMWAFAPRAARGAHDRVARGARRLGLAPAQRAAIAPSSAPRRGSRCRWSASAIVGSFVVGDGLARNLVERQPMKMAAAEALFDTEQPAAFSPLRHRRLHGQPRGHEPRPEDPARALAAGHAARGTARSSGINQLNAQERRAVRTGRVRARASPSSTGRSASWSTRGARCSLLAAHRGRALARAAAWRRRRRWLWSAIAAWRSRSSSTPPAG